MQSANSWTFMQDGIVFAEFNHQGTDRGGNELVVPNWWMGMAHRATSHGNLTLTSMFSLDAATVGQDGYRELFQVGESLHGAPVIDRQHPHDLFMQLAAAWRAPTTMGATFTLVGAAVGEPALGPIAFMHRASAADNPTAPLGHHTFDSTHIAFGVITAGVDGGRWAVEGSVFNAREPDEHRWDFDFGRLDSLSGRVWFRPSAQWELQVSSGRLVDPEQLEPGHNVIRSTASASWTKMAADAMTSATVGMGRNHTDHGSRNAFFAEAARRTARTTIYGRLEALQLESDVLAGGSILNEAELESGSGLLALTVGAVRDVWRGRGMTAGIGGDVTVYRVPQALQPLYADHPTSAHVFFRLRALKPMWNMRLGK